jgi:hypothetical protein
VFSVVRYTWQSIGVRLSLAMHCQCCSNSTLDTWHAFPRGMRFLWQGAVCSPRWYRVRADRARDHTHTRTRFTYRYVLGCHPATVGADYPLCVHVLPYAIVLVATLPAHRIGATHATRASTVATAIVTADGWQSVLPHGRVWTWQSVLLLGPWHTHAHRREDGWPTHRGRMRRR